MSRIGGDQTEYLDSSFVERAGKRFANDLLRRSGDGDIYTSIKQSLQEQLYDGLREGVQKVVSPNSQDPEEAGDIYTRPNGMIDVLQTGVYELKDKYNSIYNQINKPANNEQVDDTSTLFDRVTNPIINTGRVFTEGNPADDIDGNGRVDSEEISVALNGNLGKRLATVQEDIRATVEAPGNNPFNTPFNTPVDSTNPLLRKQSMSMSGVDTLKPLPNESIYKQSDQVQLVSRGLSGHIESVNLFNRGHPF